ncbi:NAD(P)-binding protein [Coniochaeta hoffmannii]|uniref:NAD(P)-binding protein n=1 Tax=Coniochaeta hoffmannii TaxID=91930 RepID=A0AA38RXA3_9PEZI|nr:NAD(P)-binding protein [Coniochaeta hoffmannii]
MTPPPSSILLLGAGELGTAILSRLAKQPELSKTHFTVAVRPSTLKDPNSDRLANLRSLVHPETRLSFAGLDLGAENAQDTLRQIIRAAKADVVISCTGFAGTGKSDSGAQILIAEAVLESGVVKRYFPWQFGVDYDIVGPHVARGLMSEQCAVRTLLREKAEAAGVEWVIVSTGMFMSFVFEEWFGVVEGLGEALKTGSREKVGEKVVARGLGGWESGLTLTDVEDIGRVLADLVVRPLEKRNDRGGSVVFTAGQTVTYRELADVLEKVLAPETRVDREEWTLEYLKMDLEKDPEAQLKKYRVLFGSGEGVSWDKAKTINARRGIDTVGVEQWLREKLSI